MKKYKNCVFITVVLIFFLSLNPLAVGSSESISFEKLPEDIESTFISNIDLSLLTQEPEKNTITTFDVNEKELIAIGNENFDNKFVCVYSNSGIFQYGYHFNCSGSIGIDWNNNNIIIYFIRSDVAVEVDSNGNIINTLKIKNTVENNDYLNNFVLIDEKIVDDNIYSLENDIGFLNLFSTDYSQLTKTDEEGEKTIIYDVNSKQKIKSYSILFFGVAFAIIVLIGLKRLGIRTGKQNTKPLIVFSR